ncbi:hypothetical protein Drose_19360 [Dactylosporangium roseum]|uniref:Uncharacterized protein n=1 Tax=Dactylosporangium roseum TaxID=47989 RepID=A0ABY5YUS6_9ACTN|nr:hypothetical protein [Dactylosporangium roseum]UWZ33476.1 hypothetical protein Drose_19360 [Dactylosporangium roseum]
MRKFVPDRHSNSATHRGHARTTPTAGFLVAVALAAAGCSTPPPAAPQGSGSPSAPPPSTAAPAPPAAAPTPAERQPGDLPRGLLWYDAATRTVHVYNPATGARLHHSPVAGLPAATPELRRLLPSPDGRWAASSGCGDVHVLRWTGTGFSAVARHPRPGEQCFRDPRFRDGRVWWDIAYEYGASQRRVSTELAAPQTLREEVLPKSAPRQETPLSSADGTFTATVVERDTGLEDLRLKSVEPKQFEYQCVDRLDRTTLACGSIPPSSGHTRTEPYGRIAIATVDLAAKTVTVRSALPASDRQVTEFLVDPDGSRFLVHLDDGWHLISRAAGTPPALVTLPVPTVNRYKGEQQVVFWQ